MRPLTFRHTRRRFLHRSGHAPGEDEAAVAAYGSRVPRTTPVEALLRELDRLARGE